jgi:transcriptional regulator with GAF, ATPase, and Fis domain
MAKLIVRTPDAKVQSFSLSKRITTIGRGQDNDIRLEDPRLPDTAVYLLFDGVRYHLSSQGAPFQVQGKRRDEHILAPNDTFRVGDCELWFEATGLGPHSSGQPTEPEDSSNISAAELAALQKLMVFSQKLLGSYDLDRLLENLMDEMIELTRADKGFLILVENNQLQVKVARNVARENIEDAVERVSDSIIGKVIRSRRPLIISDALADPEFKASESVVNLKLLSIMCAPLMHKGEIIGLIYLGNDRLVNRFEQRTLELLTVFASQASLLLLNAMLVNELKLDNTTLRTRLENQQYGEMVGACPGMREVYKRVDKIAPTDISVLIAGETGTGKELIARELHRRSPRAKGPFVSINCSAIPENLLESELFGHLKGAFTGAVGTKLGKFQAANGGTLFLDEIGEMPLHLQVKLLRALQEKIIYKVGDHRGEPVDIRVIAASNKVLEEEVKKGTVREDLYYRLNVVTLRLPPLRERGEDVVILGNYFLHKCVQELKSKARSFTPSATIEMKKYAWPGNVRELENRIKKAVVLSDKPAIGPEDLDLRPEKLEPIVPLADAKEEFQKRYINEVLERNGGNRTKTAKDLGVDPRTIFRHLEKLEAEKEGRAPDHDDSGSPRNL